LRRVQGGPVDQVQRGQRAGFVRPDDGGAAQPVEGALGDAEEAGEAQFDRRVEGVEPGGQVAGFEPLDQRRPVDQGQPFDDLGVVRVPAVDQRQVLRRRHRRDLPELVELRGVAHQPVPGAELGERHPPHVGLHRPPRLDQAQHVVVVQREGLDAEVVDGQELAQPYRVAVGQPHEPAAQPVAERLAHLVEQRVLVERLAAGGGAQFGRVDHAPGEERPVGQQALGALGEQHALEVDPVARAGGRVAGHGQHEGGAGEAGGRDVQLDDVERGEAQHALGVSDERVPPRGG
jgi:hypothetical protein